MTKDLKQSLIIALRDFSAPPLEQAPTLEQAALNFWNVLGYSSDRTVNLSSLEALSEFNPDAPTLLKALLPVTEQFRVLFQLTTDEVRRSGQPGLGFSAGRFENALIESYLFVALELEGGRYTRSDLADSTRALNRVFGIPVIALFKQAGHLSIGIVQRRQNKRDESRDVLEKISLIRDIDVSAPHRAHLDILAGLHLPALLEGKIIGTFVELERALARALDVETLNKAFFKELSNWFYWAANHQGVWFPDEKGLDGADERGRRRQVSLIRLITRLMFVWFLREKGLVPPELFEPKQLEKLLNNFKPTEASDSSFYQAILQNLFFATLNTEMGSGREFVSDKKRNNPNYGVHSLYRYADAFVDPAQALETFASVPFLNGGLFECLDRSPEEEEKIPEIRIDGFSSVAEKRARLPNELFFAPEHPEDLNAIYGTKGKRYRVRGLINLLGGYKFTVNENTPIEEEVALDPELLGKAFENLLAAYNPETEDTARKKTGSFYTPKAVVDYMVDEALRVPLERTLAAGQLERVRDLLNYTQPTPDFSEAELEALIATIDGLKILDPACGSGAFPIGVLQKLVYVLGQLDPHNARWKAQQRSRELEPEIMERIRADLRTAGQISDDEVRTQAEQTLKDRLDVIEKAFDQGYADADYARKLFLIENCIYGVDIQPIAVQIAKLRCFIALVIDQKSDTAGAANRGILPLPNLETQFVAANTLLKLEGAGEVGLLDTLPEMLKIKADLKRVRHAHFLARRYSEKKKLRGQDKELRAKLSVELQKSGFPSSDAGKMATFDLYDQNSSAPFFDSSFMFGLERGFDIVIGNPPYGVEFTKPEKDTYKKNFKYQDYQIDSYLLFLEDSFNLAIKDGVIAYIIPNTWLINIKQRKIRQYIFSKQKILSISQYNKNMFDAIVDTNVFIFSKSLPEKTHKTITRIIRDTYFEEVKLAKQSEWAKNNGDPINVFANPAISSLAIKLAKVGKTLDEVCSVTAGVKPYEIGKGTPQQTKAMVKERIYDSKFKIDDSYFPLLRGSDIFRYSTPRPSESWIKYGLNLAAPRKSSNYLVDSKIVIRQTGDSLIATLDKNSFICMNNMHIINRTNNSTNLYYILGLINSKLMTFYFRFINPEQGEALAEVKRDHVGKLPIAKPSPQAESLITTLVNHILTLSALTRTPHISLMVSFLEQLIDALVYELYLPEDLHAAGRQPLQVIGAQAWPEANSGAQALADFSAFFERIFDPGHEVRKLVFFLDSLPVVRLIEGKSEAGAAGAGAQA
ncbi:Eco57I restriction-modification methylase domain-containing protein [Deinococcus sp. UYEF24]